MPLIAQKKIIGVKTETAQGTAVTLDTTDFLQCYDFEGGPDAEMLENNPHSSSLDRHPHTIGKKWQDVKFRVDLKGSGAAGTAYAPLGALLQASGLVETVVASQGVQSVAVTGAGTGYTEASVLTFSGGDGTGAAGFPIVSPAGTILAIVITNPGSGYTSDPTPAVSVGSGATFTVTRGGAVLYAPVSVAASANFYGPGKAATVKAYEDGLLKVFAGCMFDPAFTFEAGKKASLELTGKGVYAAVADAAFPTNEPNRTVPAVVRSANFYSHGYQSIINKLDLKFNNELAERPNVSSANSILGFQITGRQPDGSIDPEAVLVAAHDFHGKFISGAESAVAFTAGDTTGNRVVIGLPKVQYGRPQLAERNGLSVLNVPLVINRSTGDDFATFLFT